MTQLPAHRLLPSTPRAARTLLAATLLGALAGCGGGDGGEGNPAPSAAPNLSYSPTRATASAVDATPLSWRYVPAAGSTSVSHSALGVAMQFEPAAELTIAIDPVAQTRTTTSTTSVHASTGGETFTGSTSMQTIENLVSGSDGSRFDGIQGTLTVDLTDAGGQRDKLVIRTDARGLAPACTWIPDRVDLDQLAIGAQLTTRCAGTAAASTVYNGQTLDSRNVTLDVAETWTLQAKIPTLDVRGTTYSDVIQMRRDTTLPDPFGSVQAISTTYWLARGIGLVKMEGAVVGSAIKGPQTYELVSTTLR